MNNKIKNIWIFHHYATPPTMSGLTRPYDFAIKLKDRGYNTTVFSSSYLHFSNENLIKNKNKVKIITENCIQFVFLKTPSYINSTFDRAKNMIAFYFKLLKETKKYIKQNEKPDIIIASSPHPLSVIAGIQISRRFKVQCICEVRDLWPDAIFTFGKINKKSILGRFLLELEHWMYKKSDKIIFLKEGDTDYLKEQKWDLPQGGDIDLNKCFYINNGVDIKRFDRFMNEYKNDDPDLNNNKFTIIYTGSIRPMNNVGKILDCAKLLNDYPNIQFLIYGGGNQLDFLNKRIIDENIKNVKLKGHIDKKYIPYILSKSSINVLNYSQIKYNWSRGNSSNKLFEYMASGKPIISTVKMGYCLLDKYQCGYSLNSSSPEEFAELIINIYNFPKFKYDQICKNARIAACNFDFEKLTDKLISVINN